MTSHLNLRSLAFYGAAIGSVVVLFSLTTAYGEANVKAPTDVDGLYVLADQNLPGCLNTKRLALDVKQSGVYLTGALLAAEADQKAVKAIEQHPPLTGEWNNQQLSLSGSLTHLNACQGAVAITGTVDGDRLDGTLRLKQPSEEVRFTAQRQKPAAATQGH